MPFDGLRQTSWPFEANFAYLTLYVVRVTSAYSDTFPLSRGCHCKRGRLYYDGETDARGHKGPEGPESPEGRG